MQNDSMRNVFQFILKLILAVQILFPSRLLAEVMNFAVIVAREIYSQSRWIPERDILILINVSCSQQLAQFFEFLVRRM
jgi:hypothetical protein